MFTIYGGTLGRPLDLTITAECPVTADVVNYNVSKSSALGLKTYREAERASAPYRLAVIGGGPSINDMVDEIRDFDGDIWAVNGAFAWCFERGIEATMFSADPSSVVARWAKGAKKALLEAACSPELFEALKDADVTVFNADGSPDGIIGAGTTASGAPHLACRMGHRSLTFFGCESSYKPRASHAYHDEGRTEELLVECGGEEFLTAPDYYVQAQSLAGLIRDLPEFLSERSGGLMGALVKNPEFRIKWVSDGLVKSMSPIVRAA